MSISTDKARIAMLENLIREALSPSGVEFINRGLEDRFEAALINHPETESGEWSFLSDSIRRGENGMIRQGVCYAFPPGTKFRVGI